MVHDSTSMDESDPLLDYPSGSRNRNSESYTQTTEDHHGHDQSKDVAESQVLPWRRKPNAYWLLPFILLVGIAAQISVASQEQLVIQIICKSYIRDRVFPFPSQDGTTPSVLDLSAAVNWTSPALDLYKSDLCNTAEVQALAAVVKSRLRVLRNLTVVFTVAYYSSLSDRYGRKVLFFLTVLPVIIEQGLLVYLARHNTSIGIWILYGNALLHGLLGGGGSLMDPAIMTYTADCTTQEQRSMIIGMMLAVMAVGGIVGPALGGYITRMTGDETIVMAVSLVCLSLTALYSIIMPESHRQVAARLSNEGKETESDKTKKNEWVIAKAKRLVQSALSPLLIYLPGGVDSTDENRALPSRYTLVILLAAYGCFLFAWTGVQSIFIPFTNLVFQWTTFEDGIYYSFAGACSFTVYVAVFPGLQKLYKMFIGRKSSEKNTLASLSTNQTTTTNENLGHVESEIMEEEPSERSATTAPTTENKAVSMDLGFIFMGCLLSWIAFVIVPLFQREQVMFESAPGFKLLRHFH
ncbi:major facilitator superfamily domain-containing protein [Mortierella sp. GBAus27b]|nr:major facilitator superfamily domain-containing protein [Mortierella sp. GBAus27b]